MTYIEHDFSLPTNRAYEDGQWYRLTSEEYFNYSPEEHWELQAMQKQLTDYNVNNGPRPDFSDDQMYRVRQWAHYQMGRQTPSLFEEDWEPIPPD